MFGVIVAVGLPCGLTWVVRRGRLEGRSVVRTAAGWVMLWARPRAGWVGGRRHRPQRLHLLGSVPVFVASGEDGP
jgi:hypothetical protein